MTGGTIATKDLVHLGVDVVAMAFCYRSTAGQRALRLAYAKKRPRIGPSSDQRRFAGAPSLAMNSS
jgi:hypothetical protein